MATISQPLGLGLYGVNGHQVMKEVLHTKGARLVAVCDIPEDLWPDAFKQGGSFTVHPSFDALLDDHDVDIVSLCSKRRADQAAHALAAIDKGKHVYAEKPCALKESELDLIIDRAKAMGKSFREMSDTVSDNPWYSLRAIATSGSIGDIVQVHAQKSYPWHEGRSPDDEIDGGLLPWVGIHAFRMVEQISGVMIRDVTAAEETSFGSPRDDGLVMAAACLMQLENGGIASITANYLNPRGFPSWGNDAVRLFGTKGMAEVVDGGQRTRWVVGTEDRGEIPKVPAPASHFQRFVDSLREGMFMEMSLEAELHATRMSLRARDLTRRNHVK